MYYLISAVLFLGVFVLPIYLAIKAYRKKEKKIVGIESKCFEITSISEEIINNLQLDRKIKEEQSVLQYLEISPKISPFLSKGVFAKSLYTALELNETPSDLKKYVQLEDHNVIGYNLVTS